MKKLKCICGKEVEMSKQDIKVDFIQLEEVWMGECESCLRKYDLWVCNKNGNRC